MANQTNVTNIVQSEPDTVIAHKILTALCESSLTVEMQYYRDVIQEDLGLSSERMDQLYNLPVICSLLKPTETRFYKGRVVGEVSVDAPRRSRWDVKETVPVPTWTVSCVATDPVAVSGQKLMAEKLSELYLQEASKPVQSTPPPVPARTPRKPVKAERPATQSEESQPEEPARQEEPAEPEKPTEAKSSSEEELADEETTQPVEQEADAVPELSECVQDFYQVCRKAGHDDILSTLSFDAEKYPNAMVVYGVSKDDKKFQNFLKGTLKSVWNSKLEGWLLSKSKLHGIASA